LSKIFFCADSHFGHANILKYSKRPFSSVGDMDEALINNWNNLVKPNDTVYHLGDFAFLPYFNIKQIANRLNGTKHLILGNHDKEIIRNKSDLLNSKTFATIQNYYELRHNNETICLFHYGQRVWNKSHHGSIHLFGHSHGSLPPFGRSVDVGVDCKEITEEYRPISFDEVIDYMFKRPFEKVDHHGSTY